MAPTLFRLKNHPPELELCERHRQRDDDTAVCQCGFVSHSTAKLLGSGKVLGVSSKQFLESSIPDPAESVPIPTTTDETDNQKGLTFTAESHQDQKMRRLKRKLKRAQRKGGPK